MRSFRVNLEYIAADIALDFRKHADAENTGPSCFSAFFPNKPADDVSDLVQARPQK